MAAVPGTLVDSLMSEYATPGRTPFRLRLVAFLPVLLVIATLVAGCGASGPGANSTAAREAALRQIALEYAEDGDLEQATGALEKLKLANPGQLLVTLAEADLAAGRAREDIAATAALATMLGARSQKLMAYLSPTPIPAQAPVQAATLAPAQIALVEPTATEAPSPTAVPPTATPAPVATATPEPTVVDSPTPPPQPARVVADGNVNLRSGPGRAYPVIGTLRGGQETAIIARNENGDWWQVEGSNGALAWVARVDRASQLALAVEYGIKNSTLGLVIALTVVRDDEFAVPAAVYSIVMYVTAVAVIAIGRRMMATSAS